jgi:uncharacterized membrane protein YgcG
MAEAMAAPIIGPNGEDRSIPAPREANAGAGRRDFVGAAETVAEPLPAPPPPLDNERDCSELAADPRSCWLLDTERSVSFTDQDGDTIEFTLNERGVIDYVGNGELLVEGFVSERGDGIEMDEVSGGILVAKKWLTVPQEDERERVLRDLVALIERSDTAPGWVRMARPRAPRFDANELVLGDECAVQSLQECLRDVAGSTSVEGCRDCIAHAREDANSSSACSSTLEVLRNESAVQHVCSFTAGALWRAAGSMWLETFCIAVARTLTVATLVACDHCLVLAAFPRLLEQRAPSRYLAVAVMLLCAGKTALLRWLLPSLISKASLLVEYAIASIFIHHRFDEELRARMQAQRSLWRSHRVARAFLRMRAASIILPRWLSRRPDRPATALPARPGAVSVIEGDVVARMCHTMVLACIMLLLNEHLELVDGSTGALSSTVPAEALRGLLRQNSVTNILPSSFADWTRGDLGWWLNMHDFSGVGMWLAHAGVDGSLLVNLSTDDKSAMYELAELGFGPQKERKRLLGQLRALGEQLVPADAVEEPTPELPGAATQLDFWRYRQLHRRHVTMLSTSLFAFPRATMMYIFCFEERSLINIFGMFKRALLQALDGVDAVLARAQYVTEGAVFESSWLRASLFPLFVSGSLFVPYLVLAVCASLYAGTNMWVTFAFITAMLGAMDQEHAAVRATLFPPGPLTRDSLRRLNIRGLWSRSGPLWTQTVKSAKALLYTVCTYPIYPWVLSDLNLYFLVNWQLVIAFSGPFILARRGRYFCAGFRVVLLGTAVVVFEIHTTTTFWVIALVVAVLWAITWCVMRWLNRHNLALVVDRKALLKSSVAQLNQKDGGRLAQAALRIKYVNSESMFIETGVDAGGLYRDWMGRVIQEFSSPAVGFFVETDDAVDGVRYLRLSESPTALSGLSEEEVAAHYRFFGRLIALALRDGLPLCVNLAPPLCRMIMVGAVKYDDQAHDDTSSSDSDSDDSDSGSGSSSSSGDDSRGGGGGGGGVEEGEPEMDPLVTRWKRVLRVDDMRYISLATYASCLSPELSPRSRAQNIREGGLTFATDSRELQALLATQQQEAVVTAAAAAAAAAGDDEGGGGGSGSGSGGGGAGAAAPSSRAGGGAAGAGGLVPEGTPPPSRQVSEGTPPRSRRSKVLNRAQSGLSPKVAPDREVTADRADEYAILLCQKRLVTNVELGLRAICQGVQDVPAEGWPHNAEALQELLAGSLAIDVGEWRRATDVSPPIKENSVVVEWFWSQLAASSDAERGQVLFWLTGMHRPPSGGFRRLDKRMTLQVGGDVARLPCCHTCSFTVRAAYVPSYPS